MEQLLKSLTGQVERYMITVIQVTQTPIDVRDIIVVAYDMYTEKCACSNRYNSAYKNKQDAIRKLQEGEL